jgi:hypothetical protein
MPRSGLNGCVYSPAGIWAAWLLNLSLVNRNLVAMVHLHVFGNFAMELGTIEILFGKFLYT